MSSHTLAYHPPIARDALLGFLSMRAIPGVEELASDTYRRVVAIDGTIGVVSVRVPASGSSIEVEIDESLAPVTEQLLAGVRRLFDLDADPAVIDAVLSADPRLRPLVAGTPGLRVPGAVDGFEIAVRAIIGQQISVAAARTIAGRIAARLGQPLPAAVGGLHVAFPRPEALASAAFDGLGMPASRGATLVSLARAICDGRLDLAPDADRDEVRAAAARDSRHRPVDRRLRGDARARRPRCAARVGSRPPPGARETAPGRSARALSRSRPGAGRPGGRTPSCISGRPRDRLRRRAPLMSASENLRAHRALESVFELLYATLDGARLERRSDLIVAICPAFPIPQFNGAWVAEDSQAAVDALPGAIAEVEASGTRAWVQTRTGHDRTRQAALDLGLTHTEVLPGMVMRPDELVEAPASIAISRIANEDADETNELLARAFEAPKELFEQFRESLRRIEEVSWYVGRVDGAIVSTGLGFTVEGVTGVFNVATPPEHRGRGYGSAVTSRVLRDAFDAGSQLAFLQTSELGYGVYRRLGFRSGEEYLLLTRPFSLNARLRAYRRRISVMISNGR